MKIHQAKLKAAVNKIRRHLPGGHPLQVNENAGMGGLKALDQRQQGVNAGVICSYNNSPPLKIFEVLN
jgi:hypothetical protein